MGCGLGLLPAPVILSSASCPDPPPSDCGQATPVLYMELPLAPLLQLSLAQGPWYTAALDDLDPQLVVRLEAQLEAQRNEVVSAKVPQPIGASIIQVIWRDRFRYSLVQEQGGHRVEWTAVTFLMYAPLFASNNSTHPATGRG